MYLVGSWSNYQQSGLNAGVSGWNRVCFATASIYSGPQNIDIETQNSRTVATRSEKIMGHNTIRSVTMRAGATSPPYLSARSFLSKYDSKFPNPSDTLRLEFGHCRILQSLLELPYRKSWCVIIGFFFVERKIASLYGYIWVDMAYTTLLKLLLSPKATLHCKGFFVWLK